MAILKGNDIFLYIGGIKVGKEVSHSLTRDFNFLEKKGLINNREIFMTDKEGAVSLEILVDYDASNSYKTLIGAAEAQAESTFALKTGVDGDPEFLFSGNIVNYQQSGALNDLVRFQLNIIINGEFTVLLAGAYQAESTNLDEITVYSAEIETTSYTLRNVLAGTTQSGTLNFAAPAVVGGFADGLYPAVISGLISGTEYELSIGLGGTTETIITQFNISGADQELLSIAEADYLTKTGVNQYGLPYTQEPIAIDGTVHDFSGNANHGAIKGSSCLTCPSGSPPYVNLFPQGLYSTRAQLKIRSILKYGIVGSQNSGIIGTNIGAPSFSHDVVNNLFKINKPSSGTIYNAFVGTANNFQNTWIDLTIDFTFGAGFTFDCTITVIPLEGANIGVVYSDTFNTGSLNIFNEGFQSIGVSNSSLNNCQYAYAEITFNNELYYIPIIANAGQNLIQQKASDGTIQNCNILNPNVNQWVSTQDVSHFAQKHGARKYEYLTQSQIDFEIGAGAGITRTNGYTFAFDGSSGTQYIQPDITVSGMQDLIDTVLSGVNYTIEFTISNYVAGVLTLDVGGDISNTYAVNGAVSITLNASTTAGQLRFSSFNFEGDLVIDSIVCNTLFASALDSDGNSTGFDVLGNPLPTGYGTRFFDFGESIERKVTPVDQTFADAPPPIVSDTDYGAENTTQATDSKWGLTQFVSGAGGTVDAEIDKLIALAENPAPKIIKR